MKNPLFDFRIIPKDNFLVEVGRRTVIIDRKNNVLESGKVYPCIEGTGNALTITELKHSGGMFFMVKVTEWDGADSIQVGKTVLESMKEVFRVGICIS